VWINASDIYNRTPFVFGETAFAAMCSDIRPYPIADAVAASAAVPVAFAPIVMRTYPTQCPIPLPDWITRARANPDAPPQLKAFAEAIASYHDGSVPYIKLLDGGLVDNYGLTGFTISRLSSTTPYGPLTQSQAVKLRRMLFLIVDAGRNREGDWVKTVEGPSGTELISAVSDTAIVANVYASYTAFDSTMADWRDQLIRWRCSLSEARRRQLGAGPGWSCRDVRFFIGRVNFGLLGPERAAQLGNIETRFRLPQGEVDALIEGGADALKASPVYRAFLSSL
jgi:NTE family protein